MAKRRSASGINKSELIRKYVTENPSAKPKAVAEALSASTGEKFTPVFVSTIKSADKKRGGKKPGKRGRRPGSIGMAGGIVVNDGSAPTRQSFSQAMPIFMAANQLLKAAGDRATAREVLDMVAALREKPDGGIQVGNARR